jgi:uncharacterized membrane protein
MPDGRILAIDYLHISDAAAAFISLGVFVAHYLFVRYKERHDPRYTLQALLEDTRIAWIERMIGQKEGILAVQTLRNQMMAATFFASTAILLIIGTLTLSAQGDKLTATWSLLSPFGAIDERVWLAKLMFLLVDLLIAFGFFAQVIRLLSHISMLVSAPSSVIEVRQVAALLLQAGRYHTRGVRCYYYAFPLLFWLFGPLMFVGASVALVALMLRLHRAPRRGAGSTQVQLGV